MFSKLSKDYSNSSLITGLIAVIISFAGPLAIVFQAASSANLPPNIVTSWVWAISIGSAVSGLYLSWKYKAPIITAFSTPGAALLVGSLSLFSFQEAIGAFVFSGALIFICGITGIFKKIMNIIPASLASAMLAGILFSFGISVFTSMQSSPVLVVPMIVIFLICKRLWPRFAIVAALAVGLGVSYLTGMFGGGDISLSPAVPVFTMPIFSVASIIGIGIPLFVVTMTSQNVPGVAVLKAAGFDKVPPNNLVSVTGLTTLALAPFGAHGVNLAAITAAICTGPESNDDPTKRYVAGLSCGFFYLLFGSFGAAIAGVFTAFPAALIAAIAGLALFSAITNGLVSAMVNPGERDPALITFLVTASGITILGVGAAFWGLVAGVIAFVILVKRPDLEKEEEVTEPCLSQEPRIPH
ncbi:MAG: benzoate transporter [unclassified Hahellaceae]|nr:benzoate transporter [Hahellaceae bacterium]